MPISSTLVQQYLCPSNVTPVTPFLINIFLIFLYVYYLTTQRDYLKTAAVLIPKAINDIIFLGLIEHCKFNNNNTIIKLKTLTDIVFAILIVVTVYWCVLYN